MFGAFGALSQELAAQKEAAQNERYAAEQWRLAMHYGRAVVHPFGAVPQAVREPVPVGQCPGCGARERFNGVCAYCGGRH